MGQPSVASQRGEQFDRWFGYAKKRWRLALLTLLAATAVFGGLDTVDKGVTPFKPGEEFGDGQFTLTIERARLVDELKGALAVIGPANPGKRYLGVVATLRNDGTVPGRLRDELDLRGLPGKEFFGAFRLRDGSPIQTLGPGLTEELAFTWTLPEDALKPGDSVTIWVWKKSYKQLMVTYGGKEWIESPTDYGETVVQVAP